MQYGLPCILSDIFLSKIFWHIIWHLQIISKRCAQDRSMSFPFTQHKPTISHFPVMASPSLIPRCGLPDPVRTARYRKTGSFTNIKSRVPQFLNFHVHIYMRQEIQPLIFLYKEFLYSAWTVDDCSWVEICMWRSSKAWFAVPWDLIYVQLKHRSTVLWNKIRRHCFWLVGVPQTDGLQQMFPGKCGTCIRQRQFAPPVHHGGTSVCWRNSELIEHANTELWVRASGLMAELKRQGSLFPGWTPRTDGIITIFWGTLPLQFLY